MKYSFSIIILIVLAVSARAQLYEYRDANGNTVFTDNPPSGAAARLRNAGEERVFRSTHQAGSQTTGKKDRSGPREEEKPGKNYHTVSVVLYTADW